MSSWTHTKEVLATGGAPRFQSNKTGLGDFDLPPDLNRF
jgi:hypothetical protein